MNYLFILKLTLAPGLVALASLAGRRWGLRVGGAFAGFPVVVGPTLLIFALEQGTDFAAQAALKALWSVIPYGIFCVVVAWASLRTNIWVALILGWAAFMGVAWAGIHRQDPLPLTAVLAVLSAVIARACLPFHKGDPDPSIAPGRFDIPLRMGATLALILSVTAAAKILGPAWSGTLAAFPVASSILAFFAHRSDGPRGPGLLYHGTLLGGFSFQMLCVVLAAALQPWGLLGGFAAALSAAICVQIGVLFLPSRRN